MRNIYSRPLLFFSILLFACSKNEQQEEKHWTKFEKRFSFFEFYFTNGVACPLNGKIYAGLGRGGTAEYVTSKDFYCITPELDVKVLPPFPGEARENAVAFALGKKIYVGLGYQKDYWVFEMNEGERHFSDFWAFDTETRQWEPTPLSPAFPGKPRQNAIAFVLEGKAYVGLGEGIESEERTRGKVRKQYSDLYTFSPETGWSLFRHTHAGISGATAFTAGGRAYICASTSNGLGIYVVDPAAKEWIFNEPIPHPTSDFPLTDAAAFVTREEGTDYAYLVCGRNQQHETNACWRYDISRDYWGRIPDFPIPLAIRLPIANLLLPTNKFTAFTLSNKGHVICGKGLYLLE